MGQSRNRALGWKLVVVIIIGIFALWLVKQYRSSLFLSKRQVVNIGVFSEKPFVYSYDRNRKIAHIVNFEPDIYVNVPGGYGWYKLGSVNLLGQIENNQNEILKQTFAELAGAPIDLVVYPKKAKVFENQAKNFLDYFYNFRQHWISQSKNSHSVNNLFDRLILPAKLNLRADRLIVINTENLILKEKNQKRYYSEKLDSKIKGFLYQEELLHSPAKVVIFSSSENYLSARKLMRQVEGLGLKVLELKILSNEPDKHCLIKASSNNKKIAKLLADYYNCQVEIDRVPSTMIGFYLNTDLANLLK